MAINNYFKLNDNNTIMISDGFPKVRRRWHLLGVLVRAP